MNANNEIKPFDWQEPLVERQTSVLRRERAFLSAAHTGSGKTVMAIQTAKDLGIPTLVVCPKIAISQWRDTAKRMNAEDLLIGVVNPENLITSKKNPFYSCDTGWTDAVPKGPALLIFDEIHRSCSGIYKIKDVLRKGTGNQQAFMVARWINPSTPDHKVLAMSATPADSPMKMQALGYLMGFHRFLLPSFYDWCRRHGCSIVSHRAGKGNLEFTRNPTRARTIMAQIRADMGDRFMSVTPDEIPGFPEETREVLLLDLDKEDHDGLVEAYAEMPEVLKKPTKDAMVKILRLRQQAEFCKAKAIADKAADLEADGNSVFIALNFTDARLRVEAALRKAGVEFASVYGGQSERERQAGIYAFQRNEVHVIVGMTSACGVALSLHDERHERPRVSLLSPGYNAAEFSQALGRIRRVGGTHATQYVIIAAGSVEEQVGKAIERKLGNIEALTDKDLER